MRYLIKLENWYFEWSTGVKSPITDAMSKEELEEYYFRTYGDNPTTRKEWEEKIVRVESKGIGSELDSVDELIEDNSAGAYNECLTKKQIIKRYQWDYEGE